MQSTTEAAGLTSICFHAQYLQLVQGCRALLLQVVHKVYMKIKKLIGLLEQASSIDGVNLSLQLTATSHTPHQLLLALHTHAGAEVSAAQHPCLVAGNGKTKQACSTWDYLAGQQRFLVNVVESTPKHCACGGDLLLCPIKEEVFLVVGCLQVLFEQLHDFVVRLFIWQPELDFYLQCSSAPSGTLPCKPVQGNSHAWSLPQCCWPAAEMHYDFGNGVHDGGRTAEFCCSCCAVRACECPACLLLLLCNANHRLML